MRNRNAHPAVRSAVGPLLRAVLLIISALASAPRLSAEEPAWAGVQYEEPFVYFAMETRKPAGPGGVETLTALAQGPAGSSVFVSQDRGPDRGALVVGRMASLPAGRLQVSLQWGAGASLTVRPETQRSTLEALTPRSLPVRDGVIRMWRRAAVDHFDRLGRIPGAHSELCDHFAARMSAEWKMPRRDAAFWAESPIGPVTKSRMLDAEWFGFAAGGPKAVSWPPARGLWPGPMPSANAATAAVAAALADPELREAAKVHPPETLAAPARKSGLPGEDAGRPVGGVGGIGSGPPAARDDPGRVVPADWFILRFGGRSAAYRFANFAAQATSAGEGLLGVSAPAGPWYDLATGSFVLELTEFDRISLGDPALAGSDWDWTGGSDLTLILPLADPVSAETVLSRHRGEPVDSSAAGKAGGLRRHVSPDGSRTLYSMRAGRFWLLSHSANAVRRMAALAGRPAGSLVTDAGYRSRPPPAIDEAVLHVPEACVARLTGPRHVLFDLRRTACRAHLRRLGYGQALHRFLAGRPADSVAELCGDRGEPVCPHGGHYRLGADRLPRCTVHGTDERPDPVAELPDDLVTRDEAREYRAFAEAVSRVFPAGPQAITARVLTRPTVRVEVQARVPEPVARPVVNRVTAALAEMLESRAVERPPDMTGDIWVGWRAEGRRPLLSGRLRNAAAWLCAGRLAGMEALGSAVGTDPSILPGWSARLLGMPSPGCPLGPEFAFGGAERCRCLLHAGLNTLDLNGTASGAAGLGPGRTSSDPLAVLGNRLPPPLRSLDAVVTHRDGKLTVALRFAGPEPSAEPRPRPPSAPNSRAAAERLDTAVRYLDAGREAAALKELRDLLWLFPRTAEAATARKRLAPLREAAGRPELDRLMATVRQRFLDAEQARPELEALIDEFEADAEAAGGSRTAEAARAELARLERRGYSETFCVAEAAVISGRPEQGVRLLEDLRRRAGRRPAPGEEGDPPPGAGGAAEPAPVGAAQAGAVPGVEMDSLEAEALEETVALWRGRVVERRWAALEARILDQALAPAEALPLLEDFRRRHPGFPAAESAARMARGMSAQTAGGLLERAAREAAAGRFERAAALAGKVRRYYPGSSDSFQAESARRTWTAALTKREAETVLTARRAGRLTPTAARDALDALLARRGVDDPEAPPGPGNVIAAVASAVAEAKGRLDAEEAAESLAEARAAAETRRPADAVRIASRLIEVFPDTPAAREAAGPDGLRMKWWRESVEPELTAAALAAAAGRLEETLRTLDGLPYRSGFPEALAELGRVRTRLLGSEAAVELFRLAAASATDPKVSAEAAESALKRLTTQHPDEPVTRRAAALLGDIRTRESARLLEEARRMLGEGPAAPAPEATETGAIAAAAAALGRLRSAYGDLPAAREGERLTAGWADGEARRVAALLSAGKVAEANARLAEVRRAGLLAPKQADALAGFVHTLGDIRTGWDNAQDAPARDRVARRLQEFVDAVPAPPEPLRAVAAEWAEKWKVPLRKQK